MGCRFRGVEGIAKEVAGCVLDRRWSGSALVLLGSVAGDSVIEDERLTREKRM